MPEGYDNVHSVGGVFYPYAKAGPLGFFIKHVRKADLNIVTAEWVGWGHRVDVSKAARVRTILAGTDPAALDYYGAKHVMLPLSGASKIHDPDLPGSAVRRFLDLAVNEMYDCSLADLNIKVVEHDFSVEV